jgi:DNA-binding protein H-NS
MHDDLQMTQQSTLPIANSTSSDPTVRPAPKFRNTENPAQTWAGRGKRPNWLKAQLAAGRHLDEFRIAN